MVAGNTVFAVSMTLYTDAFVIKGSAKASQRPITDILNAAESQFIVLEDVSIDEHGSRGSQTTASHAQVNLDAVLFAVGDEVVDHPAEPRTPRQPEKALVSVPPFKVTGTIPLPELDGDLRQSLEGLVGRFIPVTDATYWSDQLGEGRRTAIVVAVNHRRAQIVAPFQDVDPWAGLGPTRRTTDADADLGWDSPSGMADAVDRGLEDVIER